MELQTSPARRVLDGIRGSLDGFDAGLVGRGERLECAQLARGLASRLTALSAVLLAKADAAQESLQQAAETGRISVGQARLERRLQRQAEAAQRNRSLVFRRDGNGSILFTGSLPLTDAETWIAQLDAYTESKRRTALEERDPLASGLTPEQRRADALIAMIPHHAAGRSAPKVGGDRPRIVVTVDYSKLLADATAAGLIRDGELLSAGDLRRLCCDADLLPAVLGGPSTVLDVGRDHRLVPADLRAALVLRDGGCVFPGCHTRPTECEAHHIIPWWKGGPTALSNLVLLCHRHHGLVEPARYAVQDQWQIRIADDGIPETSPPQRCDPQRRPLRHARHHAGQDPGTARGQPAAQLAS